MASSPTKPAPESRLAIMELANMISVPMALHAVVKLQVPETLALSPTPLTPTQILTHLRAPPTASPTNLRRLLRLLSAHDVFLENPDSSFSLTDVGRTLVPDSHGNSFAPYVLQHHQSSLLSAWAHVDLGVLDPNGLGAFAYANGGVGAYDYYGKDEEANELMRKAMWGVSVPFMDTVMEKEAGMFEGAEVVVDVGGSSGACLSMIMDKAEGVKRGINFDLPEVVAGAPEFPGITHVGGDMFKSIPKGDVIFMKWILTTWTDDECELILKNCYNALPEGGKVIACEPVLPEETDSSQRTRALLAGDIFVMTIYRAQGKERTEEEFRKIVASAGFQNFRAIYLDPFYTVLELKK